MPRSGPLGTFTLPGAQATQQPNTPVPSAVNNQGWSDVEQTFNSVQPEAYGGTAASTFRQAMDNLSTRGNAIAAAATTDLSTVTGVFVHVTGATTITSFGTASAGATRLLVFDGSPTITHNATSLVLPGGVNISATPGDSATVVSEGAGNWRVVDYQRASGQPLINAPRGYINGLTLSNNATDAVNDIDIAAGSSASDGAAPFLLTLATTLTKRLDAAWAVGSGNGGLDTGAVANDTYHLFLIQRSDTGVVDALFSLSPTAPTMPTNYDRKRRIGSFYRNGGSNVLFTQQGNEFLLLTPALDIDAVSAPGTTAALYSLSVPSGLNVGAIVNFGGYGPSNTPTLLITSPAQNDIAVTDSAASVFTIVSTANQWSTNSAVIRTDTSRRVRARASLTMTRFKIATFGWVDTRGTL